MSDAARWQTLSAALDALFDCEGEARERALAEHARRDPAFAGELRDLLRAAEGDGLLERGVARVAPELLATLALREELAPEDLAGRMIGHWRVLRELGRGGMGQVLLAERGDEGFAQQAAVKRLKRGMDSDELLRRFAQERRILAGLNHPHIARLLDGGIDAEGRPFFAMEYVEGETITEYARRRGLGVRDRLALMRQVCEVVAYAQSRLVVHRDLKPSNILVDGRGEPRLLDFGIAKLLADSSEAAVTGTGLRVLSPAYAAPEQILGAPISTATDVYALGVLLYELLTAQLPHRRDPSIVTSGAERLAQETTERPSLALRRAPPETVEQAWGARAAERERLVREIGGDLDRIVLTALRREPERRYASAAALASDLALYLDGRPIAARPDTSGYRLRTFLRRHRVGASATALVLLSLLAGFGVALWQAQVASRHAAEAERQRLRAEAQARRAEQVKDFVVSLLENANPEQAPGGAQMAAVDLVRDAAQRVEQELGEAPESQAELRIAIGSGLAALGAAQEGQALLEAGVAQLRALGAPAPLLGEALHTLAMQYELTGRIDAATQATRESLALLETVRASHAVELISARTTSAKLAGLRGDLVEMERIYREILRDRTALLGADHPRLAVDWNNLAATALRLDRFAEAERAYTEAGRLLGLDPQSPASRQAWIKAGRGVALLGLGEYAAARRELESALAVAETTLHAAHPIVAAICNGLSALAYDEGRPAQAEQFARRALAIYAATRHHDQGLAELHLGLAQLAQRQDADARDSLQHALGHLAERRNAQEPMYLKAQAALGLARLRLGEARGQQDVDAALAAFGHRSDGGSVLADALGLAADAARQRGATTDALRLRAREVSQLRTVLGVMHPRTRAAQALQQRENVSASR
jgi:eukaryotic-like serine/threonine-protein kinase